MTNSPRRTSHPKIKPKKFDWVAFHKLIHNAAESDPQNAEIFLDNLTVDYDFLFRPRDSETGHQIYHGSVASRVDAAHGLATALHWVFPEIEFRIGPRTGEDAKSYCDQVRTRYRARTQRELERIISYLRTVKEDGGNLPARDATFFCYD